MGSEGSEDGLRSKKESLNQLQWNAGEFADSIPEISNE